MTLSDTDWARIAMLIECEGCFTALVRQNTAYPRITVANTDPAILRWAGDLLPGAKLYRRKGQKPHHREVYTLEMFKPELVAEVIGHIIPYLFGKRQQAFIALGMLNTRDGELRLMMAEAISEINHT